MDQKTDRIYPSAPLKNKNDDLERRMEKRLMDVNSFIHSINNVKELIQYFKDKKQQIKKEIEKI